MALVAALQDGFRRDPLTAITAGFLAAVCALALIGPWLTVHDPLATDVANALRPPSWRSPAEPTRSGATSARASSTRPASTCSSRRARWCWRSWSAALLGSVAGFFGGWVDRIAMWVVDTIMAFPLFVLAMGIVAALGSSVENIVYATAIVNVPFYARTVRAEINQRREAGFVEAARVSGNGSLRVLAYHLFPTTVPQLAVQMTLTMGWAMLNAAALSYIGLGIRPPTPEWGIMVAEGAGFIITGEWWVALFPGLALVLVVLSLNLLGDGLRDMIDARERR